MRRIYSMAAAAVLALFTGCASVKSTADFYMPYTTDVYPPKAKDAPIPILGKAPPRPFKTIGRLRFSSGMGWRFMRESMLYNARVNGADAVILRSADSREQVGYTAVPPQTDWVPVPGPVIVTQNKKGNNTYYQSYPSYIPIFRPGYWQQVVETITSIDAEMIVFR